MAGGPTSPEAVQERAAIRAAVRKEYVKHVTNPHRHATGEGGVLFDPAIQRFMAMRACQYDYFKPTPKTSLVAVFGVLVPIFGYGWWLKTTKESFEHKLRVGQIAYRDREFKFQ